MIRFNNAVLKLKNNNLTQIAGKNKPKVVKPKIVKPKVVKSKVVKPKVVKPRRTFTYPI